MVINNGETISFNKITGPHTLENGYKTATIIYNSRFVEGVGGGVCQASTTLYNALLRANIQIDEVNKHTLPVKYVPLALDAMVSEYISDLKFTNNTGSPIYIKTFSDANSVSVEIYGKPNEEGFTYDTRSETLQVIAHTGDVIKADEKGEYSDKVLFKGEYFRLTYPREGYEAVSYLQIYKDGELVEERKIRHEIYKPQNGIVIEGIEEVPAGMEAIDSGVEIIESCTQCINVDNMQGAIPTAYCP
jgi:vancomycin resistance protein YoaR